MNKFFISAFFGLLFIILISSCNEFPKTEEDCVKEAKTFLGFVTKSQYDKLYDGLQKYELNYSREGVKKYYSKLESHVKNKTIDDFTFQIKKDTLFIKELSSTIISYEIFFFNKSEANNAICNFNYSIASIDKHYELLYFSHNFSEKIQPIIHK